jgi:predicted permease
VAAPDLPQIMTVRIDPAVLLVALAASALGAVVAALIPVVHLALPKHPLASSLHGGGRSESEGREGARARHLLVVSQVALALVLLVGSGLMVRTYQTLRQVDPGFREPHAVQTFQLTVPAGGVEGLPGAGASTAAKDSVRTLHAVVEALGAVPGVESAAFSAFNDGLPLDGDGRQNAFVIEGQPAADDTPPTKEVQYVSPRFLETLRMPLLAGRPFDWNDVYQDRPVVVVSENLARAAWGTAGAAVGKRIGGGASGPWWEVVGVVKDVHHDGLDQPAPETVIYPAVVSLGERRNLRTASFVIRSARVGTTGFLEDLRKAIWSVDRNMAPANVRTLGDLYQRSVARTSMSLLLLATTATIALLLGLIGICGVVSYTASRRRREIGIRLALGATQTGVGTMFVRQALVLVGVGVAIGLGAAAGLTRLMASQLFGVSPLDPLTHAGVAVVLVTAAGVASYLTARRASALDPVEVLKGE